MNDYIQVDQMIDNWKRIGMSREEIVIAVAQACMGWPYVFGAWGELCTPANRKRRSRDDHPTIVSKCQVLSGKKSACNGCGWYPGGVSVRCYDCRGFTDWTLNRVGIDLRGEGATSQWNNDDNWAEKGPIKDMPRDRVCCLFSQKDGIHGGAERLSGRFHRLRIRQSEHRGKRPDVRASRHAVRPR